MHTGAVVKMCTVAVYYPAQPSTIFTKSTESLERCYEVEQW